jgi:PAS domain S-box-containing protein
VTTRARALGERAWLAALPGALIASAAVTAGIDRQLVFLYTSLAAGIAILIGTVVHRPRLPLPWWMAGTGLLIVAAGRLTRVLDLGFPTDALYLIAYVLLALAIGVFLVERGLTRELLIDIAIVFLSISLIWWVVLLGSRVSSPEWIADHTLLLTYPLFDLALVAGLVGLVLSPGPRSWSYRLLLTALAFQFLTDTLDVRFNLVDHSIAPPLWLEIGWILSLALFAASALHPTMVDVGAHPHVREPGLSRQRLRAFALISAAAVVMTILTAPPGWHASTIATSAAAGSLVFLMFLRLWLMTQRAEDQVRLVLDRDEKLRANERRLERLLENSPDAIALLDAQGMIVEVSSSPIASNVEGESAVGRLSFEYIHEDDLPLALDTLEKARASPGTPFPLTLRVHREEGGLRWLDLTVTNLLDDPSIAGMIINFRDVTQRVELEAALNESQKMEALGRLAGGIAHDFNNVLSVIQGFARFALEESEDAELQDDLREVLSAADRAAALVSQLLTFAKPASSEDTVDLDEAIRRSSNLLRRALGEDVDLRFDLAAPDGVVNLTSSQLDQVLLNLAVNARDAMPNGGELAMSTSLVDDAAGPSVELRVEDRGTGIPEDQLDKIFEPFFTTKEQGKGTGLGLATIYGIVRGAEGNIDVTNRPEGGACFSIHLPLVAGSSVSPDGAVAAAGPVKPMRVLLVEDEDGVRASVHRSLQQRGHSVTACADPAEALDVFAEAGSAFDVLISDIVMPVMSGVDLYERLSRQDPGLKVIYITGYASEELRMRGMATGVAEIVNKPFAPEALDAAMARISRVRVAR